MRKRGGEFVYSATDLVGYLECEYLTRLDRALAAGLLNPPLEDDPVLERIAKRGELHERRFLGTLRENGACVTEIEFDESLSTEGRLRAGRDATIAAMRAGAEVIYQAVLYDGRCLGFADFLRRVEEPSNLGLWGYEVWDTKLARSPKASAVLQLCFYSDLVAGIQGIQPQNMYLALGGFAREEARFRVADYSAYFRLVAGSFERFLEDGSDLPPKSTPDPVAHCEVCRWSVNCRRRWRESDDLALVANLDTRHRLRLRQSGITTRTGLARLADAQLSEIEDIGRHSLTRARDQAEIQVRGDRIGEVISERIGPPAGRDGGLLEDHGLLMLPEPTPDDLFVDFEGDPFFESSEFDGIEYLFGALEAGAADDLKFHAFWSIERGTVTTAAERRAFEEFIDLLMGRLEKNPDLHVYHYSPYEPAAVRRLAGRHNTREEEVDRLLRGRVFVDLYRAVRQGIRASVESYSIKKLEPLYGFDRKVDLREAGQSLVEFETWLELDNEEAGRERESLRQAIQDYNRDDCISTLRLRDFLERERSKLRDELGRELPRPAAPRPEETGDSVQQQGVNRLVDALLANLPTNTAEMDSDQRATWLLAQLLNWHRREDKSFWWEYFRLRDELDDAERIIDSSTLGGLSPAGSWPDPRPRSRSTIYAFSYPAQEHAIELDTSPHDPATGKAAGSVVSVDDRRRQIQIRRGSSRPAPRPNSLIPFDHVNPGPKPERLRQLARWTQERGIQASGPNRAGRDLLRRVPPRLGNKPGQPLHLPGQDPAEVARQLALGLDESYLAIQGPPGSGKSTTGAEIIVDLVESGLRVGVTANSHKVYGELMAKVAAAAEKRGRRLRMGQRSPDQSITYADRLETGDAVKALLGGAYDVIGGTTWLWAREELIDCIDVLVIDEAGQMSLADALAASACARNLVLLGDPQQLNQPLKGVHPPGAERSAMGHILDGDRVISPEIGVFLDGTWRLHPRICCFTSEVFYEGQLRSRPDREKWLLEGAGPLSGAGIRLVPVSHAGNSNKSAEEARELSRIVGSLLASGPRCRDPSGSMSPITDEDVLIITPYNAQVAQIEDAMPGARVGTVDKFQGQEAPVSIYSMATSSPADAPRGMEFLYSLNRLNVATSRAQCLTAVIANPDLVQVRCRTPRQMRLANAMARFFELAELPPDGSVGRESDKPEVDRNGPS